MKLKYIIITICFVITSLLIYIFLIDTDKKLPQLNDYTILSDNGLKIPAKLYSRVVVYSGKQQKKVTEIIICFDESLLLQDKNQLNSDDKLYKYLVVIPELELIGLPNNQNSFKVKTNYILQTDEEADDFTSIVNNNTFFTHPPITKATFTKHGIAFNTYGILKQYGGNIIITKINKKPLL